MPHSAPVPPLVCLCHRVKAQDNGPVVGVAGDVRPRLPLVSCRQGAEAGAVPLAPVLLVGVVLAWIRAS